MIDNVWKDGLVRRFGAAAQSYEKQAEVQQKTAIFLSNLIKQHLDRKVPIRILEIGCGTGYLTRALYDLYSDVNQEIQWHVTDISEDMLKQCQSSIPAENNCGITGHKNIIFSVMDGENPDFEGPFDLICSNMAFQWFRDLEGSLHKLTQLLSPQGLMAFTSLASDTFDLWHRCQKELSIDRMAPEFPPAVFYTDSLAGLTVELEKKLFVQRHNNGLEFLRNLREIGAHSRDLGRNPLGVGELRSLLKNYESYFTDGVVEADYDVVFVLCSKNE
ncbi:methyltransferase domain-containing protein [Kiloniella antarctica]|uniref:Methyltransferase domain-containing protein n=1 Tax=Kiloniella antarctica TaxID=1550907 RepID=A0ABW5BLS2_9PROT